MLETYLAAASALCLYFLLLSLANSIAFRRLNRAPRKIGSPKVSILVPARDEERNIRACLDSLLEQDYGNHEILVLDDNSSDGTAEILREYEGRHGKLRTFSGRSLPPGWLGKHYACHQLSEMAEGEYFLFTDADTVHKPSSVSWAVTNMMHHEADFMSAYPRQRIGSFGEAMIVPGIYLITSFFLPVWMIPSSKRPNLSFAIGQLAMCRADAFRAVGGYERLRDSMVDDISMVRNMKAAGFKTLFLDGRDYLDCRMYHGYREAFSGLVKNMYAALDKKMHRLLAVFLMIALAIELPLVNLIYRSATGAEHIALSAMPVAIFFVMWFVSLTDRKLPPYVPFLYPLLFLNLMTISVVSAAKTGYGKGALWKGRRVK
jgi:chlorobactene glucosyltransferase